MRTFLQALRTRGFAITAELPLTPDSDADSLGEQAKTLEPKVDAILVPDNRFGRVHMSPLAAAAILKQHDIDPLMELGCRYRTRVALISDLLGARALGITNLLLIRGKKAPDEIKSQAKFVIDTNVRELIGVAKTINEDEALPRAQEFFIGTTATVHDPVENWNPERLQTKTESGARFIQTQLCLDVDILKRYVQRLVATGLVRNVNIIVTTAPITSVEAAHRLKEDRTHVLVPDSTIRRLQQAKDPIQEGIAACAEFLQAAKQIPGVSGFHLVSASELDAIPAAIDRSAL